MCKIKFWTRSLIVKMDDLCFEEANTYEPATLTKV
jgi:hypothetical protein